MNDEVLTITCLIDENTEIEKLFYKGEFDQAVEFCEKNMGYEGGAWELVKSYKSIEVLHEFLEDDGVDTYLD